MATIKEIAKMCNVSIATVSNILNGKPNASEETKKRVLDAAKELNYTPNYVAKNLKMKTTRTIGVIVEDMTVFCAPEIIDGITEYCEEKGYCILLTNLRLYKKYKDEYYHNDIISGHVHRAIKELVSKQVDGIIYVTAHERILKCMPQELQVPVVMAYGYSKSSRIPSVVVDDIGGEHKIASYVLDQGHRKVGLITGKENSIHTRDRLLGYQRALYEHHVLYNPDYVVTGDWTREGGYRAACILLEKDVTAVLCMNDLMAGGVYDRLEELNMIPGTDISVAGYDNREVAGYYKPPLTTVELPLFEIGQTACRRVFELMEKEADQDELQAEESSGHSCCSGNQEEYAELEVTGEMLVRSSVRCMG
ncbi:MAG: LacI family DNA-binding transcriptional regulator [Lachnospiraceae bacterium]